VLLSGKPNARDFRSSKPHFVGSGSSSLSAGGWLRHRITEFEADMSVSNRTAEKRGSFRYQINISTKPRDKIREVTIYFGYV
jgi:hypothetical protein